MPRRYYQLIASLPALEDFHRAKSLPLGRRRLNERLALLHPADLAELTKAEDLISWRRQPVTRTTEEIAEMYGELMATIRNRALKRVVEYYMNMRTVIVALRMKRRRQDAPLTPWGVGRYTRMIETRWGQPEFGLAAVFPWIPEVRTFLEQGNAVALEGLVMEHSWRMVSRVGDLHPFGFEQVFAFAFKWDILDRWLSYDAVTARQSFEELMSEVTIDHQNLFT